MPLLSYSAITDYPFQPFTKIYSSDINAMFASIQTLLNTTKLDSTNVQDAGLTVSKLAGTGGAAGQFVGYNGSAVTFVNNPLTATYNVVMGSAAQVTSGTATNSTFAGYTQADGDRVLVLPGYVTNEAWTITKKLYIQGLGNTSIVLGAITLNSGASYTRISGLQTQSNLTIASGVSGVWADDIWLSGTNTFVDNNTSVVNYLSGVQG